MPLEQPIIEHSIDLINEPVHYYNPEFDEHQKPRPGFITGYGPGPGLFNLVVFMDFSLDVRRGKPAMRHASGVLLVADVGDSPIGLRDVAVLKRRSAPTPPTPHLGTGLKIIESPANDPAPPQNETPASAGPQGAGGGGATDPPTDPGAGGDEAQAPAASDLIDEPPTDETEPKKPQTTPIDALLVTGPWKNYADAAVIRSKKVNATTLAIYLAAHEGEDRPFAKITYEGLEEDADDTIRGYTLKVRDKAGRISITVDAVLGRFPSRVEAEERLVKFMRILIKLAGLASEAEVNDYGSQYENMDQAIQEHRQGK